MPAYEGILQKAGVADSAVVYIGDDLPDIPLMLRAGLAVAVGDAVVEVKMPRTTPRERMQVTARSAKPWNSFSNLKVSGKL
jgi:3-deoxy-D-manno-octulosonate 8-phosphate phosphatase KdsC-like HAD superfamily phosphatase